MKKADKILREIDNLIDELLNNSQTSSGVVGAMQESTNGGIITGLKMARKVVMMNETK
jgi:hypothetical protein